MSGRSGDQGRPQQRRADEGHKIETLADALASVCHKVRITGAPRWSRVDFGITVTPDSAVAPESNGILTGSCRQG